MQALLSSMASTEYSNLRYYIKYVALSRKRLPDKFIELCHTHLASQLELSEDQLELLLAGHEEHKKKLQLSSLGMFKSRDKSRGLFGLPLTDEGVCLIMPLINFLRMGKVNNEGLFRKPGSTNKMAALKELLIAQGPTVSIDSKVFSANDVASVLKEFIRELPEPLITEHHLKIHMQILALGQHAKTPEEIAQYSSRKLAALQLLMLLLPSPAKKLTMHLVLLLQRVADSPESKMTSATLGTIFAPIFFIAKMVQPLDLLSQITTTTPAVAFMIDQARVLFEPPLELVRDLAKRLKSMKQNLHHTENREPDELEKLLSGKKSDTPEFCAGLRRRSRSIGSSVKKRLTSLTRSRSRQRDTHRPTASSSSSSSDSKTAPSIGTGLFEFPAHTTEARPTQQLPKPGLKRHASENCPAAVSSSSSNTPVKRKCLEAATCIISCKVVLTPKRHSTNVVSEARPTQQLPKPRHKRCHDLENCPAAVSSSSSNTPVKRKCLEAATSRISCKVVLTPKRHSTNVVSDFVENRNPKSLTSDLGDPANCDIENKETRENPATCSMENEGSIQCISSFNGKTDAMNSYMLQQHLGSALTGSSDSVVKSKISRGHLDKPDCFQSETGSDHLPHAAVKKITSETVHRNSKHVANICQQSSRKSKTTIMTRVTIRPSQQYQRETAV